MSVKTDKPTVKRNKNVCIYIVFHYYILRGSDVSGGDDHSHVRIIVWARETVRGAKVRVTKKRIASDVRTI